MYKLPFYLPTIYKRGADAPAIAAEDSGGYDLLIGSLGFRLASDTEFPYQRSSDKFVGTRIDQAAEPGEQTLSPLPWIKSQSTFHGGAGQINIEALGGDEGIEHIRFDMSQNCDVWTLGQVSRLPDVTLTAAVGYQAVSVGQVAGIDYAILGGTGGLRQLKWTSGPNVAPTSTAVTMSGTDFGSAGNYTILDTCTNGYDYFALIVLTTPNAATMKSMVVKGQLNATTSPVVLAWQTVAWVGVVGWAKERLMAGLNNSLWELPSTSSPTQLTAAANYVHPSAQWTFTAISESPASLLASGSVSGSGSSIVKLDLATNGTTPVLTGGATVGKMPNGEVISTIGSLEDSFIAIGTNKGIRIGTFDTYTGALKYGPLSVLTTSPVQCVTGRDRFLFGGYTNGQPDGKSGLFRLDLGQTNDAAGHLAWAPDLHTPSASALGTGAVTGVDLLPASGRLVFITSEGLHIEGNGPGVDNDAWLRTSRIRFGTSEPKLFKLGQVRGQFASSAIAVEALAPYQAAKNVAEFGNIVDTPGEFRLVDGTWEWIQLRLQLEGQTAVLNSYQVKAIPQERRQRIIIFTVNCFQNEVDKNGLQVTDPALPRDRLYALEALEQTGGEYQFVEFTNSGSVTTLVVIEMVEYKQFDRPAVDNDFGGYITVTLRTTES